jgi:multidrug transporter EmrE-like cation transporter
MKLHVTAPAFTGALLIAITSTAGDVLVAAAMRRIGAVDKIYRQRGLAAVLVQLARSRLLMMGVAGMTLSFLFLLWTLSFADLSFVVPGSTAMGFVLNSAAASLFLAERVDSRRWLAALFIGSGVYLLAH